MDKSTTHAIPLILFYGVGSEYVFKDIADEIRLRYPTEFMVIELDAMRVDALNTLRNAKEYDKVFFVNSSHILLDNNSFKLISGDNTHFIPSPLEIIKYLNPHKSIFVPHDFAEPILEVELPYMNLFHHIWYPQRNAFSKKDIFEYYGWIKYVKNHKLRNSHNNDKVIFFLSDVMWHLNYGLEMTYNKFRKIFTYPNLVVKLPAYPGAEKLSQYLRGKNVTTLNENENATLIMNNYDLIISNGLSSTVAEGSYLGKNCILIKEKFYSNDQYATFGKNFPQVNITQVPLVSHHYIDTILTKTKPKAILKSFNLNMALNNLLN